MSSDFDEERLYSKLIDLRIEAEASRNKANIDRLELRKLESDAIDAISKVTLIWKLMSYVSTDLVTSG